jgi:phage-related baseplate assembly protein
MSAPIGSVGASGLPEPSFIDRDADAIVQAMIADWESATGTTLYPAQPERLDINNRAYREHLLRIAVQEAAKQNLLRYARFPMLDFLGHFHAVTRQPASAARTRLRFTASAPATLPILIPLGAAASTGDGRILFRADVAKEIPVGETTVTVTATASAAGAQGNGFGPGQINLLVASIPGVSAVTNLDATTGGADIEGDEALRARIQAAPEKYSVAGPEGAYIWHAKSVRQDISDVAVRSPVPGDIEVAILTETGLPSPELLALVEARLNDRSIRPMGDRVIVRAPRRVPLAVQLQVWLTRDADPVIVPQQIDAALASWAQQRMAGLGRDFVQSQVAVAASVQGVYRVEVLSPANTVLGPMDWAEVTALDVTIMGRGDD